MLAQTFRTAVYGPVRTVVWEGSAGDRRPYPDQHISKPRRIGAFPDTMPLGGAAYPQWTQPILNSKLVGRHLQGVVTG